MPIYTVLLDGSFELSEIWSTAVFSLENILHRSWWKRIWTAQEAFLPSQAMVHVGPHCMPYSTFLKASNSWAKHVHSFSHNRWENCCETFLELWMGYSSAFQPQEMFMIL